MSCLINYTYSLLLFSFFTLNSTQDDLNYTTDEKLALEIFRPLINNILTHDYQRMDSYLIHWLRAQNLDIMGASDMIQKAQEWRQKNEIDNILKEVILDDFGFPDSIDGIAKDDSPVITYTMKNVDTRKDILQGKKDKLFRYSIQLFEKSLALTREASQRTGKNISQTIWIGDYAGFNTRQHGCIQCIPQVIDVINAAEMYYPGLRKWDILINVPRSYKLTLNSINPLLSSETKKITKIFGTNKTEWSSFLLELIPSQQLNFQFGGTKQN